MTIYNIQALIKRIFLKPNKLLHHFNYQVMYWVFHFVLNQTARWNDSQSPGKIYPLSNVLSSVCITDECVTLSKRSPATSNTSNIASVALFWCGGGGGGNARVCQVKRDGETMVCQPTAKERVREKHCQSSNNSIFGRCIQSTHQINFHVESERQMFSIHVIGTCCTCSQLSSIMSHVQIK